MDKIMDEEESMVAKLIKENELLKEELQELKDDITRAYYTMISLDQINKHVLFDEIEEI